jgi:restriction system protein
MSQATSTQSPSRGQLKPLLQKMDDWDFEHFVADLWERQGWDAEVEQQSGDAGVDIRAVKSMPYQQKALIQAKRYGENTTVGGPDIQQYSALKQQEQDADKAIVVTTSRFTSSAYDRAEDLNVKLIDGDDLVQLIDQLDAFDLVEQYFDSVPDGDTGASAVSSSPTKRRSGFSFSLTSIPGISLDRNWAKVMAYGTGLWILAMAYLLAVPPSTPNPVLETIGIVLLFVALGTTIAVPLGLYLDMKVIRASTIPWQPTPKLYLLGFLFTGPFALLWYFYNRARYLKEQ